jgi:hypothetical protein
MAVATTLIGSPMSAAFRTSHRLLETGPSLRLLTCGGRKHHDIPGSKGSWPNADSCTVNGAAAFHWIAERDAAGRSADRRSLAGTYPRDETAVAEMAAPAARL